MHTQILMDFRKNAKKKSKQLQLIIAIENFPPLFEINEALLTKVFDSLLEGKCFSIMTSQWPFHLNNHKFHFGDRRKKGRQID